MTPEDEALAKLLKLAAEAKLLVRIMRENFKADYMREWRPASSDGIQEILAQCLRVEGSL